MEREAKISFERLEGGPGQISDLNVLDDVVGAGQTLHESYEQGQAASDQVRQEHPHRSHATRVSEVYQQENRKQSDFSH